MKIRILPILFIFLSCLTGFAQNAQETFDIELNKLNDRLGKYEFNPNETDTLSNKKSKLISCEDLAFTVEAANQLLKQKVGIRADNKSKINNILSNLEKDNQIQCKEQESEDCCKENLKLLKDFCVLNGFLTSIYPKEKQKNHSSQ